MPHERSTTPTEDTTGRCDVCDAVYDVASRTDHCPECGTCWAHCPAGHAPQAD